jgi:hypothetical protein
MSALERLWKDKMSVYRWEKSIVNGITKNTLPAVPLYSDVKCHLSKPKLTDTGMEGAPSIINSYILFCALETDLKEGDRIIVTMKDGKTRTLDIGEGIPYKSHQEFSAKRDDTA